MWEITESKLSSLTPNIGSYSRNNDFLHASPSGFSGTNFSVSLNLWFLSPLISYRNQNDAHIQVYISHILLASSLSNTSKILEWFTMTWTIHDVCIGIYNLLLILKMRRLDKFSSFSSIVYWSISRVHKQDAHHFKLPVCSITMSK